MWDFAMQMFREHLVLGLGHGGWSQTVEQFAALGIGTLPPHNLFISMWAAAGMPGVLALLGVALTVLVLLLGVVVRHVGTSLARTTAFALGAWAWVLIHGMGDNTTIYGESKTMILLALMLGLVTVRLGATRRAAREVVACPA
jgi:O-antigen ligase